MPLNSQDKRIASLSFGRPWSAGTRRPTASSTAFRRAMTIGLYAIISSSIGSPSVGWIIGVTDRVFRFGPSQRVWFFSGKK